MKIPVYLNVYDLHHGMFQHVSNMQTRTQHAPRANTQPSRFATQCVTNTRNTHELNTTLAKLHVQHAYADVECAVVKHNIYTQDIC